VPEYHGSREREDFTQKKRKKKVEIRSLEDASKKKEYSVY